MKSHFIHPNNIAKPDTTVNPSIVRFMNSFFFLGGGHIIFEKKNIYIKCWAGVMKSMNICT